MSIDGEVDEPPDWPSELTLTAGPPANGGSCVARHDGRVVFVRYALPGETVRVRVVGDHGSYWHADVIEVIEPSPDRVDSICPIAGVDGAGCCDMAFAEPEAVRRLKGAVVANQLIRLGGYQWRDESDATAETVGEVGVTGWRTRVRLDTSAQGRAGFHRYHSAELVTDLECAQLPSGMLDGIHSWVWPSGAHVHVAVDDDGDRHVVQSGPRTRGKTTTHVLEGQYEAVQRVGGRVWRVPVTAFWQAHRDAAQMYSELVADWAQLREGMTAWDLYGGAGVFAAVLAQAVGETGKVVTVDTSRGASRSARAALADLGWVSVVTDSVRRALAAQRRRPDVAVLDPPRAGAGREVIDLLAARRCAPRGSHRLRGSLVRPRHRAVPGSRLCGRGPSCLRLVSLDAPCRVRRRPHPVAKCRCSRRCRCPNNAPIPAAMTGVSRRSGARNSNVRRSRTTVLASPSGIEAALVAPAAHAEHRRLLVEPSPRPQLGDQSGRRNRTAALRTVASNSDRPVCPPAPCRRSDPSLPRGIDIVIHGRSSSLMPSGVTTRAHTRSTGASTMLCRSTIISVPTYPTGFARRRPTSDAQRSNSAGISFRRKA